MAGRGPRPLGRPSGSGVRFPSEPQGGETHVGRTCDGDQLPLEKSFEDAINQGIDRANKTLRNVKGGWIKEQAVDVENGQIIGYRVNMLVTFVLDESGPQPPSVRSRTCQSRRGRPDPSGRFAAAERSWHRSGWRRGTREWSGGARTSQADHDADRLGANHTSGEVAVG